MQALKKKYYQLYHDDLFQSCIPFWLKCGKDEKNGGLLNCLDRVGEVYSTDKSVWLQGRCAWMFAKLSNQFGGNQEYLDFSKNCIDFLDKYGFDTDGRMYFKLTDDGRPLRKRRYWFSESFYIIAQAEYYKATGEINSLLQAKKVYALVRDIVIEGKDPFQIHPKVFPETRQMKGLGYPMILLNVASIMRSADKENAESYTKDIDWCIEEIKQHYLPQYHCMLEDVGLHGEYMRETADGRVVNPGHDMECAWFLAEEAKYRGGDKELLALAERTFNDAIKIGWDNEYGGVFYFVDAEGKPVEAYERDMKLWWVHNEGINSSLLLYSMTGKKEYADWFEKITAYAYEHFADPKYGEWYGYLRRDGKPTEPACKGHSYKGPFHVLRMLANVLDIFDGVE